MKCFIFIVFILHVFGFNLWASPAAERPDIIPLTNVRPEATDLIWKGRKLLPQEAAELRQRGVDISQIDPDATTDLWKPHGQTSGQGPSSSPDSIPSISKGQFVRTLESPVKTFRFVIQGKDDEGNDQLYTIFVAKRLQTYLLRRNLLRKLGYYIPPMKRLERLDVHFRSRIELNDFINNNSSGLRWNALGDKEWIINFDDKNTTTLQMQDVLLLPVNSQFVNLAFGFIRPDISQGRRLINALLVPYNLVDLKESINGLRWHSASIKSNSIYLPLEDEELFTTTLADGQWVMRKIAQLTRQDWEDIVSDGLGYPIEAQKLLVEKLISRRNELCRLLKIEYTELGYDPVVSYGDNLKSGELLKGQWPGLASTLMQIEQPSIISGAEMQNLLKSKGISVALDKLVSKVNKELIPSTDLDKIAFEKQKNKFYEDLVHFIKSGEDRSREFGIWTAPYIDGQVIASRDVVAGSFLGADNRIQLADTLGFEVETGLHVGTLGLPVKLALSAGARIFYNRSYSHLKPIQSIKAALDEPYKNILVPMLKREWVKDITPEDFELRANESEADRNARIVSAVKALKDQLQNGESLIISDSLGDGAHVSAGYTFSQRIQAQAQLAASLVVLSRLHIMRRGDSIHVYKDFGNIKSLQFVISLRAQIQVLELRMKASRAKIRTDFYKLDLNDDLDDNPKLANVLAAVKSLFISNDIKKIELLVEPDRLEHHLTEASTDFRFLFFKYFSLKSRDSLMLTRASELESEYYIRRIIGQRNGRDYQSVTSDVLTELVSELTGFETSERRSTNREPGDTVFGKSNSRYAFFEGEYQPTERFKEMFVGVNYRWKGWSATREVIEKIALKFSERFDFQFFHPRAFQQIKKAELYSMDLSISVYDRGVRHAMGFSTSELKKIFQNHFAGKSAKYDAYELKKRTLEAFTLLKIEIQNDLRRKEFEHAGDSIVRMISLLESSLDHQGLIAVVGGLKNIRIQPILTGFLRGEDGKFAETPIEGGEIGQVGSARAWGPMTSTQKELGMTESEFFVYWLMRKI